MILWTWQTKGFDIIKSTIEHRKSSWINNFPKYPELCKILSKRLKKDSFIWCFTQEEPWKKEKREKWELCIPQNHVRFICSITWNWILARSNNTKSNCDINTLFNIIKCHKPTLNRPEFQKQFHHGWKDKSDDELWQILILEKYVGAPCTHAIVSCPIERKWENKNPTKDGKWWETINPNPNSKAFYSNDIVCPTCPFRNGK
jgi:hypothetical protein